jgi:hypothetical protein
MAKDATSEILARIDADIARLEAHRAYVLAVTQEQAEMAAPKKRGRKPKARGLPANDTGE